MLGLALLACDPAIEPSQIPTTAVSPAPTSTMLATASAVATDPPVGTDAPALSCADPATTATLVAFADAGDLWVYDVTTDERRALTDDGDVRSEHDPAFVTGACVAFASTQPATIELQELAVEGARRAIVEETGSIADLAVSPDGRSVLYLHIDYDVDGTFRLKRVDIDGGMPEVVYTFSPTLGRGAGSEDEVSVAWSPDGSAILVVNTHEYADKYPYGAIYLFDPMGRQVRTKWAGTHPRWSPDGKTVYYRGHAGVNGQSWYALDVLTLKSNVLGIRPGTNWLVVSPDGRRVAYDTSYFGDLPRDAKVSGKAPDVYVYDLTTGKEAFLERGALGPQWISPTELMVTSAREPTSPSMNSWESLRTVVKISIGGKHTAVEMISDLFDSAVHLGK
jgi:hypothetical protein